MTRCSARRWTSRCIEAVWLCVLHLADLSCAVTYRAQHCSGQLAALLFEQVDVGVHSVFFFFFFGSP